MPTYEYLCDPKNDGCGHQFEAMQKITDGTMTECPECKKARLRRVIGVPGLIFKGSGWTPRHFGNSTTTEG